MPEAIYHVIEVANTHGGDINYLKNLINEFADLKGNFGIKFQPLAAHTLATPGYEWYKVYEELYFSEDQWKTIIGQAKETKDIWLDIFDLYGVTILEQNLDHISGIKFQSSVLYNLEVFNELKKLDLSGIKLILNVAAREIEEIGHIVERVGNILHPEEIILEFGFQGYPTALDDCGLSKIQTIRRHFPNRLVFADHTDAKTDDALWLPVVAATHGIEIIEKHVMLDRETKYDHFSSLTPARYKQMVGKIEEYLNISNQPFINQREIVYLQKTLMIPFLKHDMPAGSLLSPDRDFSFKRTNRTGLNVTQVEALIKDWNVLAQDKKAGDTLEKADFKKANIATIIACRLKSSRLPKKALIKIGDLTSVEFCIANALKFDNVQHTILATSDNEQDRELKDYTYSTSVIFHTGDSEDVIRRYLDICDTLRIDIVIRVTADMPFIDNEVCQFLLNKHFEAGADYTAGKEAAVGTNLEIINVQALHEVKKNFPNAEYSEYMTWYFMNNPEHFKLNIVDLPKELIRNYRLTLDYQEDLDMFTQIRSNFQNSNFSIRDVFKFLDENPEVAAVNGHLTLKYRTDEALIRTLNEETKIK